jgi:RNA polymerase sigma factor (sigma-70 family)
MNKSPQLSQERRVSLNEVPLTAADETRVRFERAVREWMPKLLMVARGIVGRRHSPEDIVQQALASLYEHRDRYDWTEPIVPLLRKAVVNEALRSIRRAPMAPIDDVPEPGREAAPDRDMIRNETVAQVRRALDRLPEHFRAVLVLCEFENLSYDEIAQTMGITMQQTKTWLFRARRQMEQILQGYVEAGRPVR